MRNIANSFARPFISSKPNIYRQANRDHDNHRYEYPTTGAFHSTRRAIVQVFHWTIDLLWWVIVMGMFGLTFAIPVIFFALMVK